MLRHVILAVSVAVVGVGASVGRAQAGGTCTNVNVCSSDCPYPLADFCASHGGGGPRCEIDEVNSQCNLNINDCDAGEEEVTCAYVAII